MDGKVLTGVLGQREGRFGGLGAGGEGRDVGVPPQGQRAVRMAHAQPSKPPCLSNTSLGAQHPHL